MATEETTFEKKAFKFKSTLEEIMQELREMRIQNMLLDRVIGRRGK